MTLEFKKGRTFSEEDYRPYIGKLGNESLAPLPNAEDVDPIEFLNHIASGGHMMQPGWGYAQYPDSVRNGWTQFFITSFMMSGCDGGGYAVTYSGRKEGPFVRRFAICKHEVEDHPGANHNRGWHPGHCVKCGFDMTYDSGD